MEQKLLEGLRVAVNELRASAEMLAEFVVIDPRMSDIRPMFRDHLAQLSVVESAVNGLPLAELAQLVIVVNRCRSEQGGVMQGKYHDHWDPRFIFEVTQAALAVKVACDPPKTDRVTHDVAPVPPTPNLVQPTAPDEFKRIVRQAVGGFGASFRDSGL